MKWIVFMAFLVISAYREVVNQVSQQNFGPYKVNFLKYEICKGPKRGECGTVHIDNIHNMSNVLFILNFPKDCPVENAKITIGTIKHAIIQKKLWNYQLNKPCQHFVLGPVINKSFNVTNSCNIVKGRYEVCINMNDLTKKFLGSSFFYDSFFFKIMAYNSASNFFCVHSEIKIFKL